MNEHIILTPEQAQSIKGRYGSYSAIEPVLTPDNNYIIPQACLSDNDLQDINAALSTMATNVQPIDDLPAIGQQVIGDRYYNYASENAGLVKCVQTHNRTIYPPEETPDLFSFFRPNTDELYWIPNEYVHLGWKRWYDGVQYEVIQAHMTLSTWTPDVTPALWQEVIATPDYPVWQQPTGAHDAYQIGDRVHFPAANSPVYESKINANVWSPTAYPAGWKLIP